MALEGAWRRSFTSALSWICRAGRCFGVEISWAIFHKNEEMDLKYLQSSDVQPVAPGAAPVKGSSAPGQEKKAENPGITGF